MALERMPTRYAALRNEFALWVTERNSRALPDLIRPYYRQDWKVERRVLYEKGTETRVQWIFRDGQNLARLVAAGEPALFEDRAGNRAGNRTGDEADDEDDDDDEGGSPPGFIEIYDEDGLIVEEHRYNGEGDEYISEYIYRDSVLIRAENRVKPGNSSVESEGEDEDGEIRHISTDYYRYSRALSLRSVERIFHDSLPSEEQRSRLNLPRIAPGYARMDDFVASGDSTHGSEFFEDTVMDDDIRVNHQTDERGRILMEEWTDEEGNVRGIFYNTWKDDRLSSVIWKSEEEERRTEYEYDEDGDRITERNFRNGVLERLVYQKAGTGPDKSEIEEIYMNGQVILRAVWENGRKTSEERIYTPPVETER
jgi:antitoxin component YwqK of YwqJK toxin-antitoxin module